MSSAESDMYIQNQRKLKFAGVDLPVTKVPEDLVNVGGIPVTPGPRIILSPSFGVTQEEIVEKVTGGATIKISQRSALVLKGRHITINSLDLDGALVVEAGDNTRVTIEGLRVQNKGWNLVPNDPSKEYEEAVAIRGYTMEKQETTYYKLKEPGDFVIRADGKVTKLDN